MSLAIDPDKIKKVLLADGWHVVKKKTFDIDSYEYVGARIKNEDGGSEPGFVYHGGGHCGITAAGFRFQEDEFNVAGPLTAILAVKY